MPNPKKQASAELIAVAKLVRLLTHGDSTGNPYRHPEVMDGLRLIADHQGIKDPFDAKPERLLPPLCTGETMEDFDDDGNRLTRF